MCVFREDLKRKDPYLVHLREIGANNSLWEHLKFSSWANGLMMNHRQHLFSMHVSFQAAWCLCSYGLNSKGKILDTHRDAGSWGFFFSFSKVLSILRQHVAASAYHSWRAKYAVLCVWVCMHKESVIGILIHISNILLKASFSAFWCTAPVISPMSSPAHSFSLQKYPSSS